ncbi:MAG: bifunctional GTP diphosphokinase/guanosine-3',5'-bis pyrophosphate 3'-pyrophosphohydrolase [Pseudomonadales bacterium]
MQTIDALESTLTEYLPAPQIQQVKRAYYFAEQAHDGQVRRSGEPYVTHPLAVAYILSEMHMDAQSLMAAMLHDVIEDTGVGKDAISEQFGETVAELVDGLSKLAKIGFSSRAEAAAENFQKMALAMARDIRVILVKLADRLHNMRTLGVLSVEKRRRIAKETLEIYAPIANRLGMNTVRIEFEDLGFTALYPMRARRIEAAVRSARGNRKEIMQQVKAALEDRLKSDYIHSRILGREKHLFSIYEKMRTKRKSFSEIMDVYAFRIVVKDVDTCYRVLGAVHNLYKPVAGHFKDYIAIPKANGYQSLHTVLFGMHGVPIEIQIRTEAMEELANKGIAAHWLYKTGEDTNDYNSHTRTRQWVQSLLDLQQRAGNSQEFIEHVKTDLFPDEVYVFTPKGQIKTLPNSATAVDFAYEVHTDVGNSCVACRINRRFAPLSEQLQSGQTIEIITAPGSQPNPTWLNFAVSGKARSNIRHFLKNQRHTEAIELGRRLLDKALENLGTVAKKMDKKRVQALLDETGYDNFDLVLEDIGLGNRVAYLTARRLVADRVISKAAKQKDKPSSKANDDSFAINGAEGMMVSFAKCCHAIPGDSISGHISAGRGIVVHVANCRNIQEFRDNPERCIELSWHDKASGEYQVELRVELTQQRGIIAELANKISSFDAPIEKINTEDRDAKTAVVRIEIAVHDRIHLARIMRRIRTMKSVTAVSRMKS